MQRILREVSQHEFIREFQRTRTKHPLVKLNTSAAWEVAESLIGLGTCYLSADNQAGFAITAQGELIALHSAVGGRGTYLVGEAVALGATHLDCFDGYLRSLYEKHGFVAYKTEPNWTEGQPDIVHMRQPTWLAAYHPKGVNHATN